MSLDALLTEIAACRACAPELTHEPRPVVRVSAETRLLICGQAPGRKVHESGLPFDDASGDRLRGWMGVDRETFYGDRRIGVAAMAFCFPGTNPKGGDFPPPPRCAGTWRKPLLQRLPNVELTSSSADMHSGGLWASAPRRRCGRRWNGGGIIYRTISSCRIRVGGTRLGFAAIPGSRTKWRLTCAFEQRLCCKDEPPRFRISRPHRALGLRPIRSEGCSDLHRLQRASA